MGCVCCWVEDGYIRWEGKGGFFLRIRAVGRDFDVRVGGAFEVALDLLGLLE